jgi:hypothetical protein
VQLHFVGNETIPIEVNLEEWRAWFEAGLRKNRVVYVHDQENARILAINPRLVTHWEHCP